MEHINNPSGCAHDDVVALQSAIESQVVGQRSVIRSLVLGLLCSGHVLLEGLPGTAKTRSVKALASGLSISFGRIQFTPDLLPSDVTGTEVLQETDGKSSLHFRPGQCLIRLSSPMRLTERQLKFRRRCWKLWGKALLPLRGKRTLCRSCLWCWRHKTR